MDRGFPFSICLCLKIYIASYKILYRKESIMDNWYEETIAEIKELMEQKKYDQAAGIVEKELSMPYIPCDVEKQLRALQKDIRFGVAENTIIHESSLDQLLDDLHGDAARQLAAVNALGSRNLRDLTLEIQDYFNSSPFPEAAALLINAIAKQQIEDEFTFVKDGVEYSFFGDCLIPVDECDGYREARKYLNQWFGMKYPSVYELALKVLVHEVYMYLPLSYEEIEGRELAYECGLQTVEMLGDEQLKEHLTACSGVMRE